MRPVCQRRRGRTFAVLFQPYDTGLTNAFVSQLSCSRSHDCVEDASYFRAGSKEETREAVQDAQVEVLLV